MPDDFDQQARLAAFRFLDEQRRHLGDVLPRELLVAGFTLEGRRVPLMGPQGIFRPAILPSVPLSITTVPTVAGQERPYDDGMNEDGTWSYRYRGTDPNHPENAGLRRAMQRHIPIIYFFGIVPGRYLPIYPVYIVRDDPRRLTFSVAVDDHRIAAQSAGVRENPEAVTRQYIMRSVQERLHQQAFRERVLMAYRQHCAICRLRHLELLDAAHILPDTHPKGLPVVPNGLALCKLHHAAFDAQILGIRPDYLIEVRKDVLEEHDGPMLQHGLQGFQGARLYLPRSAELKPNPEFLEERFAAFQSSLRS